MGITKTNGSVLRPVTKRIYNRATPPKTIFSPVKHNKKDRKYTNTVSVLSSKEPATFKKATIIGIQKALNPIFLKKNYLVKGTILKTSEGTVQITAVDKGHLKGIIKE